MMIVCRFPIAFGSYKVVKDTMLLTGIEELKANLYRVKINHIISEIYNQALSVVRLQIQEAIKAHGEKIFSLNVDNWKVKDQPRHFCGVRLYFNDEAMVFQNWLLGIRESVYEDMAQGDFIALWSRI